jgi:hypothetical protein
MSKNKKAGFYALLLVIMALILTGYTFYGITISKNRVVSGLKAPLEVVRFSQEIEKDLVYEEEKVKLAVVQAFYDTANEWAIVANENCKLTGDYMIFNDACEPNYNQVAEIFMSKLSGYENLEYDFTLEGKTVLAERSDFEKELLLKKDYALYKLEKTIEPSFSIGLEQEKLDFEDFLRLYTKAESCKNNENIASCINLQDWTLEYEEGTYKFFSFKTKKYYFYNKEEETFEPIEFNFALE